MLLLVAATTISTSVSAQDSVRRAILDEYHLDGDVGAFRVSVRAANVRDRPDTRARKTGLLKRDVLVKSLGRVMGSRWYAIEQERQFIGFMYDKTLEPVLDTSLTDKQRHMLGLDPPEDPLKGLVIEPMRGAFVAQQRDNVISARPEAGTRSVGKLRRGERVDAIGRPKGYPDWVAVGRDGQPLGFMREEGLLRVIDAALRQPLSGKLQIEGKITCAYELAFRGRSAVQGEVFGSADYSGNLACTRNGGLEMFSILMFVVEGARVTDNGDLHQVNMDMLELGEVERPFSVIMSYDSAANTVIYDTSSRTNYIRRGFRAERPADSIAQALSAAIDIGLNALNEAAWSDLAGL